MALNISRDELIFNNDGTLDMRRKINKIWLQRQHNNQVISLKKEIKDLREKNMKQIKKCKDDLSAEITKMLLLSVVEILDQIALAPPIDKVQNQ